MFNLHDFGRKDLSGGFSMYLLTKPKQNCNEFSEKNLLILGDLEE